MSEVKRANEGGKREFLRVRRARDLDTLPQKERKPRLKKTILRRNRVPPQCAIVRYIRGVVFEWRGCRSKSEKRKGRRGLPCSCLYPFCFSLKSSAAKSHFCQALPLKLAVQVFRTSATCRASEGGKREFLRVRRARDLDALPQKERKPRLKKTILRRNRVPPQCAIVRYIRGVVFEWRGCRSKSEKRKGRRGLRRTCLYPFCFSLNSYIK